MKGFKTIETRIAFNKAASRYRVNYKKDGKSNAKIFTALPEAQQFRDQTETGKAKWSLLADHIRKSRSSQKSLWLRFKVLLKRQ